MSREAAPPVAVVRHRPFPVVETPKMMTPSRFHAPPTTMPLTLHRGWGGPPATSIFLNLRSARMPSTGCPQTRTARLRHSLRYPRACANRSSRASEPTTPGGRPGPPRRRPISGRRGNTQMVGKSCLIGRRYLKADQFGPSRRLFTEKHDRDYRRDDK